MDEAVGQLHVHLQQQLLHDVLAVVVDARHAVAVFFVLLLVVLEPDSKEKKID